MVACMPARRRSSRQVRGSRDGMACMCIPGCPPAIPSPMHPATHLQLWRGHALWPPGSIATAQPGTAGATMRLLFWPAPLHLLECPLPCTAPCAAPYVLRKNAQSLSPPRLCSQISRCGWGQVPQQPQTCRTTHPPGVTAQKRTRSRGQRQCPEYIAVNCSVSQTWHAQRANTQTCLLTTWNSLTTLISWVKLASGPQSPPLCTKAHQTCVKLEEVGQAQAGAQPVPASCRTCHDRNLCATLEIATLGRTCCQPSRCHTVNQSARRPGWRGGRRRPCGTF